MPRLSSHLPNKQKPSIKVICGSTTLDWPVHFYCRKKSLRIWAKKSANNPVTHRGIRQRERQTHRQAWRQTDEQLDGHASRKTELEYKDDTVRRQITNEQKFKQRAICLTVELDVWYEVGMGWYSIHALSLSQVPDHNLLVLAARGNTISETR